MRVDACRTLVRIARALEVVAVLPREAKIIEELRIGAKTRHGRGQPRLPLDQVGGLADERLGRFEERQVLRTERGAVLVRALVVVARGRGIGLEGAETQPKLRRAERRIERDRGLEMAKRCGVRTIPERLEAFLVGEDRG